MTNEDAARLAQTTLSESAALHAAAARDTGAIVAAAQAVVDAIGRGGTLWLCGNGGSAADAQHAAAELVGRFQVERRALAAVALTTDTSVLTSIANDDAYGRVFARQIEGLGRRGDVLVGITTSGRSANVIAAIEAAKARGLVTIALTGGDGGAAGRIADLHVNVPDGSTARVQEVHRTLLHILCDVVERSAGGRP